MEKIDEQLNNLSTMEIPVGIHQSVMRRINYIRFRSMFFVVFGLLALSFLVIVWYINTSLVDAEFTDMIRDFFEVFSFNFSFVNITLTSFFEIISPTLILSAFLSLVGTIYIGKKISLYKLIRA